MAPDEPRGMYCQKLTVRQKVAFDFNVGVLNCPASQGVLSNAITVGTFQGCVESLTSNLGTKCLHLPQTMQLPFDKRPRDEC